MSKEKKAQIIDEIQDIIANCSIGILTDYRGLSTAGLNELRRKLRESGMGYRVVKNTLASFAAERADRHELVSSFEGPIAIAFGSGDMSESARVLVDYARTAKLELTIKGGFLSTRLLTAGDVAMLATLPSREILLSQVLAGMQSPIVALVSCLVNPLRGFMGVLQARMKQLEGE